MSEASGSKPVVIETGEPLLNDTPNNSTNRLQRFIQSCTKFMTEDYIAGFVCYAISAFIFVHGTFLCLMIQGNYNIAVIFMMFFIYACVGCLCYCIKRKINFSRTLELVCLSVFLTVITVELFLSSILLLSA